MQSRASLFRPRICNASGFHIGHGCWRPYPHLSISDPQLVYHAILSVYNNYAPCFEINVLKLWLIGKSFHVVIIDIVLLTLLGS